MNGAQTPAFWCWRHPRATGAAGRCIGRTDLPVNPRRAKRLAHRLRATARREQLPRVVWVSPLQRCRAVGRWLARWGFECRVDARLAELDFGRWDGRPWSEVPWHEVQAWEADRRRRRGTVRSSAGRRQTPLIPPESQPVARPSWRGAVSPKMQSFAHCFTLPPEPAMNLKTLDSLLQRAVHLGLALVVTLGMLGGIDSRAQAPHDAAHDAAHELAASEPASTTRG